MFLLIDKPKGITSHGVIDRVRRVTGERKVGHAGTLDPNATGLLLVAVGRGSTKKLGLLIKRKKTYEAEIFFGEERTTGDVEGKVIKKSDFIPLKRDVENILLDFLGNQKQVPPIFSALKIKGRKAYEFARKGKKIKLEPRNITIYEIKLLSYKYPLLRVKVEVSSGTYIRALARDMGRELGSYGYLKNLRRVGVEDFLIKDVVKIKNLNSKNWKEYAFELD